MSFYQQPATNNQLHLAYIPSLLFSQASSGADAKKVSAAVFEYCKRDFLKQMCRWRLARRAKRRLSKVTIKLGDMTQNWRRL